jgi:hypothetical protein
LSHPFPIHLRPVARPVEQKTIAQMRRFGGSAAAPGALIAA